MNRIIRSQIAHVMIIFWYLNFKGFCIIVTIEDIIEEEFSNG
jgi:hypothetical protein